MSHEVAFCTVKYINAVRIINTVMYMFKHTKISLHKIIRIKYKISIMYMEIDTMILYPCIDLCMHSAF